MDAPFYPTPSMPVAGLSPDSGIDPRTRGFDPFDFATLFGNDNPVELEIGSGKGRFLISSASADPDRNMIGIEKSLHYYRVIVQRIRRAGIRNARIVNHDAFVVLSRMVPDASIAAIHVYFPDPWPRKREQKRRLIRAEMAAEMERVLKAGAQGVYVTDHAEFYRDAVPILRERFEVEEIDPATPRSPRTNYEAKYQLEGRTIYEARFHKRAE